ncbi:PKD domain-containing protein [Streptomyces sp. SAI-126]|uniref:PKD domain-containing protein n=1 Tax=Streptomyces sp. SAI-126 TaxID=3377732 RepID=UPI003C7B6F57
MSVTPGIGNPGSWGLPLTYTVDFGDGSAAVTDVSGTVTHTYTTPGVYAEKVTVTDANGSGATRTAKVTVGTATPPATSLTVRPEIFQGTVDAGSASLTLDHSDNWELASRTVSWGDASSDSVPVTRGAAGHDYDDDEPFRSYLLKLTQTDIFGRTATATATFRPADSYTPLTPPEYDYQGTVKAHGLLDPHQQHPAHRYERRRRGRPEGHGHRRHRGRLSDPLSVRHGTAVRLRCELRRAPDRRERHDGQDRPLRGRVPLQRQRGLRQREGRHRRDLQPRPVRALLHARRPRPRARHTKRHGRRHRPGGVREVDHGQRRRNPRHPGGRGGRRPRRPDDEHPGFRVAHRHLARHRGLGRHHVVLDQGADGVEPDRRAARRRQGRAAQQQQRLRATGHRRLRLRRRDRHGFGLPAVHAHPDPRHPERHRHRGPHRQARGAPDAEAQVQRRPRHPVVRHHGRRPGADRRQPRRRRLPDRLGRRNHPAGYGEPGLRHRADDTERDHAPGRLGRVRRHLQRRLGGRERPRRPVRRVRGPVMPQAPTGARAERRRRPGPRIPRVRIARRRESHPSTEVVAARRPYRSPGPDRSL